MRYRFERCRRGSGIGNGSGDFFSISSNKNTKVPIFDEGCKWWEDEVIHVALTLRDSLSGWLAINPSFALVAHQKLNSVKKKVLTPRQKRMASHLKEYAAELVEERCKSSDEESSDSESVASDEFDDDSHLEIAEAI